MRNKIDAGIDPSFELRYKMGRRRGSRRCGKPWCVLAGMDKISMVEDDEDPIGSFLQESNRQDALDRAIVELCDHVQSIVDSPHPPPEDWYQRADLLAMRLREFLPNGWVS